MSATTETNQPAQTTETSQFSYTPPKSEATPDELAEFNDLLKGSINEIADEYAEKPPVEDVVEGDGGKSDPDSGGQDPDDVKAPTDEAVPTEIARGMQQLVQREVQLQAREMVLAQRETQVKALESELASLRQAVPTKDLLEKFDLSPSDALKAMGKDPETVVRLMIAEQLHAKGQPVPEGLQKFVEKAASERRIAALEAQLKQRDEAAKEAQVFSAVQSGAREYVKTIDGKKMPSLAAIFKSDPDLVHSELMEEIDRQASKNPNGQLTYETAALEAEKRLARYAKVFSGSAAGTTPTTQASGQKPTPPQTKAPAKPIAPWNNPKSDFDAALNDAIREFHTVEAKNKARL
jgi:hypothetical protein